MKRGREAPGIAPLIAAAVLWVQWSAAAVPGPTADFEAANKLFEQGRFAEAAAGYERLLASGQHSAALHFNLGNARFRSGRLGPAIVAYREAELLAPRDPDVRANLQFARNRAAGGVADAPALWHRALTTLSVDEWTALAAVCLWLFLLPLAATQWRPRAQGSLRPFACGAAVALVAVGACLAASLHIRLGSPTAVVTRPEVNVRYGPVEESKTSFTLRDGTEVRVIGRKEDWLQVLDASRRSGWVKDSLVTEFPQRPAGAKRG